MIRPISYSLIFLASTLSAVHAWQPDNGDGTYSNPPLYADYPDPDVIRVGNDFYMVSSTFVNSPGLRVLHSQDLVNWEIISHPVTVLDGGDKYDMKGGTVYRQGVWAPSIRYHDGTFYVLAYLRFGKTRLYYSKNPAGPWQYHQYDRLLHDPGLFFDTDGTGYIMHGANSQDLVKLSPDLSKIESEQRGVLRSGAEGTHVIKRGDYYYVFNAKPGASPFQLLVSRSKNLTGPYETKISLLEPNGGHQGGIVDLPDGNWYGFVMKDQGAIGRVTYFSPIYWEDEWPIWGSKEAPNKVPAKAQKPVQGKPVMQPATSDEFDTAKLGEQWEWNHNPDNTRWSLTERPGYLRLHPTQSERFWTARNTLTQKAQGETCSGMVKLDLSKLQDGDIVGLGTLGKYNGHIFATRAGNNLQLTMRVVTANDPNETVDTRVTDVPFDGTTLYLRTDMDFLKRKGTCYYSVDGQDWKNLGGEFGLAFDWRGGTFQGQQFALFAYNPKPESTGYADVDWFHFTGTGPRK